MFSIFFLLFLLIKEVNPFFYEFIDFKFDILFAIYFSNDDLACDFYFDFDFDFELIFFIYSFLFFGFDWADKADIVFKVDFLF